MSSETPQNQDPQEEIQSDEDTPKHSILDSINFVVNMMNEGKVDPKAVYPPGRYQGD